MINPERTAYMFLGSFLTTVFCLQWWQSSAYPATFWIVILFVFINLIFFERTRKITIPIIIGIILALLNIQRVTHNTQPETTDWYANNSKVTIHGIISDEPDRRPLQTKYTIEAFDLTDSSGSIIPVKGKTLVTDREQWPEFNYGDEVEVTGRLQKPEQIDEFHYDRYLSRFDIYSVMYFSKIKLLSSNHDNKFFAFLFNTKQKFEKQINRIYAEPHASFLAGLLTGSRKGIPAHLMENFNTTGLTHIIAISGYNITIVISVITGMLFWLPLKWRFVPAVIAIISFTLFVGASAAVVRASIMGILGLLALQTNRLAHTRLAILWTLFFMLVWNPKYLWYDAGFQLSFLAVIGLVELSPYIEKYFKRITPTLGIREALQMTISAQICAVPLIVLLFGRLSLIAPIANVLVAPAIPLAMLFGFIGTVLSFIWFPLGQFCAFIGWAFMEWIVLVATVCSKIPFASVEIQFINVGSIVIYYVLLVYLMVRKKCK
ncbi:ComEC family competence protein [Patescibacteria group bacterium]|nr:ComEC family competence protein [Patescibacteria group bacterium]